MSVRHCEEGACRDEQRRQHQDHNDAPNPSGFVVDVFHQAVEVIVLRIVLPELHFTGPSV
jgi:hypothetical protein